MRRERQKRAAIYLRVSSDEQAESGLSLESQEARCRAWCAERGLEVAGVYSDPGVSGATPIERRRGLSEALAAVPRGGVLVAADRLRLHRDIYVAAMLATSARRRGATIETTDMPSGDDPMVVAMRGMGDLWGALELAQGKQRTRAALAAKRARGERTGGHIPYGQALADDGRTLVDDRDEAKVVKQLVKWRDQGKTVAAMLASLDKRGVPPRGERWHATTVVRILARYDRDQRERAKLTPK